MQSTTDSLDFVTIEGLLAYGEQFARRPAIDGVSAPTAPAPANDRAARSRQAMVQIKDFVDRAHAGFPGAEAYRSARQAVIDDACAGDQLVFFAAWNRLLAEGALQPLLRAPIGSVLKPTQRRPVAIVPRAQLTPQLADGRIVLDLGDERFWLMPRELSGRTLLFTMRHGISRI